MSDIFDEIENEAQEAQKQAQVNQSQFFRADFGKQPGSDTPVGAPLFPDSQVDPFDSEMTDEAGIDPYVGLRANVKKAVFKIADENAES